MDSISRREWLAAAGALGVTAMAGAAVAQARQRPDDLVRAAKSARLYDLSSTRSPAPAPGSRSSS